MGVHVEIVSIGQHIDLNSGSVVNQLLLRLPDGSTASAAVDETVVKRVIDLNLGGSNAQSSMAPMPQEGFGPIADKPFVDSGGEEGNVTVFGGEETQPTPQEAPIMPTQSMRSRTVPMNSHGYPIVPNNGVDPGEVVGPGSDVDEDGVAQA